jgi:hypothetical protein
MLSALSFCDGVIVAIVHKGPALITPEDIIVMKMPRNEDILSNQSTLITVDESFSQATKSFIQAFPYQRL